MQRDLRETLLTERRSNTVVRLAESLFSQPYVTARHVQTELDVTNPTAQAAIDALVEQGTLVEQTGRKRGRLYFAPAIFDAVFADVPEAETIPAQ